MENFIQDPPQVPFVSKLHQRSRATQNYKNKIIERIENKNRSVDNQRVEQVKEWNELLQPDSEWSIEWIHEPLHLGCEKMNAYIKYRKKEGIVGTNECQYCSG